MQFIRDSRIVRIGAALTSAVLIYLSDRPDAEWWAGFLAPIPLLVAAFEADWRETIALTLLAALLGGLPQTGYLLIVNGPDDAAILIALQVLQWLVIVQRTRGVVENSRHWSIVFAYPALCAAVDTLEAALSPHGTAGSLAYSQMKVLPVIQVAAVAGTPGVVFLVSLFGSLVAVAWRRRLDIEQPILAYGLPVLVLVMALGSGVVRLDQAEAGKTIPVGLVAIDRPRPVMRHQPQPDNADWPQYASAVTRLAASGAKLIVLPEEIATFDAGERDDVRNRLSTLARDGKVYLLAGFRLVAGDHMENRAWLFSASGVLIADYAKRHPIPGLEAGIRPGWDDAVAEIGDDKFGIAICKDMDFPLLGRAYAARGIAAMLVPAWDAGFDDWAHAAPAVMRGVEGGYTVIRTARDGLISVSDRYGRVLAAEATADAPVASLEYPAPLSDDRTPYARFGGWFGWLCVAASVATLLPLRRRQQRR
jgi:apolipoprotein N-acyltransferase